MSCVPRWRKAPCPMLPFDADRCRCGLAPIQARAQRKVNKRLGPECGDSDLIEALFLPPQETEAAAGSRVGGPHRLRVPDKVKRGVLAWRRCARPESRGRAPRAARGFLAPEAFRPSSGPGSVGRHGPGPQRAIAATDYIAIPARPAGGRRSQAWSCTCLDAPASLILMPNILQALSRPLAWAGMPGGPVAPVLVLSSRRWRPMRIRPERGQGHV